MGIAYLLPHIVGLGKASELLLLGETIDVREAERIGLVNKVVPDDQLEEVTKDIASKLAKGPHRFAHDEGLAPQGISRGPVFSH